MLYFCVLLLFVSFTMSAAIFSSKIPRGNHTTNKNGTCVAILFFAAVFLNGASPHVATATEIAAAPTSQLSQASIRSFGPVEAIAQSDLKSRLTRLEYTSATKDDVAASELR